ncbi:hypothetical protein DsansV1_C22g0171441 [Dioscorea sansibarensis]
MAMLENLFLRQGSLKSLFDSVRGRRSSSDVDDDPNPIPQLSALANSVVSRCSREEEMGFCSLLECHFLDFYC